MTKNETIAVNYFKTLVESFIAHPKELNVTAREGQDWVRVKPWPDSRDFGRIVGTGGETYKRLTNLMELAGIKAGKQFVLERLPSTYGPRETKLPGKTKADWNGADTMAVATILHNILDGILTFQPTIMAEGDSKSTIFKVKIDDNEPLASHHEEVIECVSRIIGAVGFVRGRDIKVKPA